MQQEPVPLAETHPTPASFAFFIAKSIQNFPMTGPEKTDSSKIFRRNILLIPDNAT